MNVVEASLSHTYALRRVFTDVLFFRLKSCWNIVSASRLHTLMSMHILTSRPVPVGAPVCIWVCFYFVCVCVFVSREIGGEIDRWIEVKERAEIVVLLEYERICFIISTFFITNHTHTHLFPSQPTHTSSFLSIRTQCPCHGGLDGVK